MLTFEGQQQNLSTSTQLLWKSFKNLEKLSAFLIKNLNSILNKMNNIKSSMYGMKAKDAMKLNIVELDKSQIYPEKI